EHTFAMILACLRNIPEAHRSMKEGKWERKKFTGNELNGKKMGIIGLGRIGSEVAKRALAFEMKVFGYDPFASAEYGKSLGAELTDLETLLKESDIVTLHLSLSEKTKGLINKNTLALMKKEAVLVNCSRGAVINEADLHEALKEKRIRAACLDVFEKEPPENNIFRDLDNVLMTPHLGASTEEAQERVSLLLAEQVRDYFLTGKVVSSVNLPIRKMDEKLSAYMELSEKLGSMLVQLNPSLNNIEIVFSGEVIALEDRKLLVASFFKGVLGRILEEKVNIINSLVLAHRRQISWKEVVQEEKTEFRGLIGVRTDDFQIYGTRGEKGIRLVQLNDYPVNIVPEGIIILMGNQDRPGVIGRVATILGESRINIARMEVGRTKPGDQAITCVEVDSSPDEMILKEIMSLDAIQWVSRIEL
ncbi:MAG TPA: NAD(P)-dependent oxidoreductase, partial [bacterium]|nr:NAD(P)-dependent oxidoreductase [bacterium]